MLSIIIKGNTRFTASLGNDLNFNLIGKILQSHNFVIVRFSYHNLIYFVITII